MLSTAGMLFLGLGMVMAMLGYVWLVLEAFKMGLFWVFGLFIVPCFPYLMLFADVQRVWRPLVLNTVGGTFIWGGWMMLVIANPPAPPPAYETVAAVRPSENDPLLPGSFVAPEVAPVEVDLIAQMDPMVVAAIGGGLVFLLVGTLVGSFLLMTMRDDSEEEEPAS